MLSIENLPPDDPSCPREISQLNKAGDERASGRLALQQVDLQNSGLNDDGVNTVLPKFSIRDYVFSARSKDIKTNWPFSQKNLQLCLKHEVTDLLPPFQPLDILRDQPVERCTVETNSFDKQSSNCRGGESCSPSDELVSVTYDDIECNQNLSEDYVNIRTSGIEEEEKNPSTTTLLSSPGVSSVPTDKSSSLELETNTFPAPKREASLPPAAQRSHIVNQLPVKKCRLIVKLSKVTDQGSNEDISINNFLLSESMASKVCPVCKIFSSSSNTTLNAHIDQCLSGDASTKWKESFKEVKHRIKPRKTRTMEDIYVTAKPCTLEELDRRNGTNWASNSTLVAQASEICAEEKKKRISSSTNVVDDTLNNSAVYIDSNGTKVRILSKFNDAPSISDVQEAAISRKPLKGPQGRTFFSNKRKRRHMQKHYKLMKLVSRHDKEFCFSKPHHNYRTFGRKKRNFVTQECPEEKGMAQHFRAQGLKKVSESMTLTRWVCSKRTGFTKKANAKDDSRQLGYEMAQGLPDGNTQSTFGDASMSRFRTSNKSEDSKRLKSATCKYKVDLGEGRLRKRIGSSSLSSRLVDKRKSSLVLSKHNKKQPSNERLASTCGSCEGCQHFTEEHISSPCKTVDSISDSDKTGFDEAMDFKDKVGPRFNEGCIGNTNAPKITKRRRGIMISRRERTSCSESHQSMTHCYHTDRLEHLGSSARVDTAMADKDADIESSEKDIGACNLGNDVEPASPMEIHGSFGSKSLDAEIHDLASPSDTQCDSQRHDGVYEVPFCGAEASSCRTLESLGNVEEMFCSNVVGRSDLSRQNIPMGVIEPKYATGSFYSEVDPIPIPGPPGSYLPSPGDTDSEDLLGNSSLTTSRVQSFEDHHDMADKDSSDSPFSVTSTISNSALERSDLKPTEMSLGHQALQNDCQMENSAPVMQQSGLEMENLNFNKQKDGLISSDNASVNEKNDLQCCCSHKEEALQRASFHPQMTAVPQSATEKEVAYYPSTFNLRQEGLPLRGYPIYGTEVILPSMEPLAGHIPMKASADSEVKFQNRGDCHSASPSSSSVLRLMGKNLTVVNKEEHVQTQLEQVQSNTMDDHLHPWFCSVSGVSPGNIRNEGFHHAFNHVAPHAPMIFGQNQHGTMPQHFDVRIFGPVDVHSKTPQSASCAPRSMLEKNIAGGFTFSSEPPDHQGRYSFPSKQHRTQSRHDPPFAAYNIDKNMRNRASMCKNLDTIFSPAKDIVIIDDIPYNEMDAAATAAADKRMIRSQSFSAGTMISIPSGCSVGQSNPLQSCQPQELSRHAISMPIQNVTSQTPPSMGLNGGGIASVKWHCVPEGHSVLLPASSIKHTSTSTGHLRSTLYHSRPNYP